MSGHSHWSTIKHKKGVADQKRGKIFSKISRMISVAAREKGGDPETNPQLRQALDKAKDFNVPKENIERAIKKGTGELGGMKLEKVMYEAYGPGNVAIIIEGITDNRNRSLNDVTQILNQHNGKLADPGSVRWMFERRGVITISPRSQDLEPEIKEELELKVIEAGAEDVYWHTDTEDPKKKLLDVYTKIQDLEKVKEQLEKQEFEIESATLDWVARDQIEVDDRDRETCQKLFEALDENDTVQDIYSNLKT
jgi:YebC/PmpR family DNA-binding regulatory protein